MEDRELDEYDELDKPTTKEKILFFIWRYWPYMAMIAVQILVMTFLCRIAARSGANRSAADPWLNTIEAARNQLK